MFNGYNDTPLISYEFSQERVEKKHENVAKWSSYGGQDAHTGGIQPAQAQPNNRHPDFWTGKSNFLGIPNVVKCNCAGCYLSSEKQSYQGDTTRHRPWLPRTYPVPVNGSNEPCKLPACQWDSMLSNQGSCYPESGLPYVQENGGKHPYYRNHQNSRLVESNQPGVITSVKNADYGKKSKGEMPSRGQNSPVQNGARQPVFCNPSCGLTKRVDGRNYCDSMEKYSNVASYSVDQHIPRLPVVEPFAKAVPSNLSQSRVPSTGYRSVKENMPQPYIDLGYGDARKMSTEEINCEQSNEVFPTGQLQAGVHADYSPLNSEAEQQKLFFDNTRHPEYYSRNNFQEIIKRNSQALESRKDCAMHQINEIIMSEQHYISRAKHQEGGNGKPPCDVFYSKDLDKPRSDNHLPANSACFQRSDDTKNENAHAHAHGRLPSSALLFNDPRFADRTQNSFTYQSNPVAYRNYIRPEYPYQGYNNAQARYEYPSGLQRNDLNQYRSASQQLQNCEQLPTQQGAGFAYDPHFQQTLDKTQQLYRGKNPSPVQPESQLCENKKPTYLEAIRSEELNKNGTSKISPLRLLRKKKFINVPQESAPASNLDAVPGLDVRKFWSTWAEEEEENVATTQMVVLDCQNIDPEQAKLLHLYETDPVRPIHLDANNTVIKNADADKDPGNERVEVKTCEQLTEPKVDEPAGAKNEMEVPEQDKKERTEEKTISEPDNKNEIVESVCQKKTLKKGKLGKKKAEIMDKWTEKKFDFLKRAEESKAAEILRHEEEKKKIFETRLTLQQSVKKSEKSQEKPIKKGEESVSETLLAFDENSRSDCLENNNAADLPTSEYRRNKFLDYSNRKVLNGEDERKLEDGHAVFEELVEVKKEETESSESRPLLPKLKEEAGFEMDDILKKMSEINFQNTEVKLENGLENVKKLKSGKKLKKRKQDHQPENEELTVETVTKPTIKFSIQKSHDLKISFKVLNSKEYSDEDIGGDGAEDDGKPDDDSKNSTELITLKYKSIKREGDIRQLDLKKRRRRFRQKKKQTPKTPILKLKKSSYMPEEERDPLADDDDTSDKCSASEGFQVEETMDSAKIKLTFKRHKGNFETEYKINSSNMEKDAEGDSMPEENDERDEVDKDESTGEDKPGIFAEAGVENFQDYPEPTSDADDNSYEHQFESILEEESRNPCPSPDPYIREKPDFRVEPFSHLPSGPELTETLDIGSWEEETGNRDDSNLEENSRKLEHLAESSANHVENECKRDEFPLLARSPSPDVNLKQLTPDEVVSVGDGKAANFQQEEEIQEISLDFITSTKLNEIKSNHDSGKTEKSETSTSGGNDADALEEKGSPKGIGFSEAEESFSCGVGMTLGDSKIQGDNIDEVKSPAEKGSMIEMGEPETTIDEDGKPPLKETTEEENQEQISFENVEKIPRTPGASPQRIPTPPEEAETNNIHNCVKTKDERTSFDLFPTEQPEKDDFETYLETETTYPETVEENQVRTCIFENSGFSRKNSRNDPEISTDCETADMYISEIQLSDSGPSETPRDDEITVPKAVSTTKEDTYEVEHKENPTDSKGTAEAIENTLTSPTTDDRELRENVSGFPQESTEDCKTENIPFELEDGEIVDGCDESEFDSLGKEKSENQSLEVFSNSRKKLDFISRKIERRVSTSEVRASWSRKRFSKAKSCPPKLMFPLPPRVETPPNIPVEDIPLPLGPPPWECCFDFGKYANLHKTLQEQTSKQSEAKEKPKELTPKNRDLPPDMSTPEMSESPPPGILQRSGKIKFSFIKRSKFSKIGLKTCQNSKPDAPTQAEMKLTGQPERQKVELPDVKSKPIERDLVTTECQMVVPKGDVPEDIKEVNSPEDAKRSGNDPVPIGLSCDDLGETVEVIDTMNDYIRDEFYECEDIPTSEDLTNGEDLEIEKVNDDKFRNIMQNCLDNAKKFLNVGNLKLFSCSVDDLLELDCQDGSGSSHGENEPEKSANHISRDVLLTSCEDTNDDLGLSENNQPSDISMDFVPSFCSDVCPEILPVDNWPYLEEEVPSSPVKTKPDDADLIPTLENVLTACDAPFSHKNGIERRRKRVVSETSFKRFRPKSLLSDGETLKIGVQRRKTIDSVTAVDLRDIKSDIILLKSEAESRSLKCRLSLDKITSKQGFGFKNERMPQDAENGGRRKSLDYRSPSWQPKVMLFRISKTELRKVLKSSKSSQRRFAMDDSMKRTVSCDLGNNVTYGTKKRKLDSEFDKLYIKPVQKFREMTEDRKSPGEERLIDLSRLDSIKGSLTSADPEARKRKKSRFRNLHTKRKSDSDSTKDISSSAESVSPSASTLVDAEAAIAEIFKDCDHVSVKNPKLVSIKDSDQRPKKKPTCESERSSKSERRSQNETEITHRSKEEWKQDRHRERKDDHRDRRREKSEGREQSKREDKHRESERRKHRSSHDSSRYHTKRSPSKHSKGEPELRSLERRSSEGGGNKWRPQREASPEACWVCEVCGFNDASERVLHIKSHPFHCQSCHLAFKTEAHFTRHLTKKHKDIRNQHHCLLCELSFDTEDEYQRHLETREHRHLESVEKNTINTLFTLLTGAPCPVFGLVEMRPEWLPNQAGTVHFYHQATPLSLALQKRGQELPEQPNEYIEV